MPNPTPLIDITAVANNEDGWAVTTAEGSVLYIPNDSMNRHWQDVQDWINTPGNVVS